MREYTCSRCGIRVVQVIDPVGPDPYPGLCLECGWIESLDTPEERQGAIDFLDRLKRRLHELGDPSIMEPPS